MLLPHLACGLVAILYPSRPPGTRPARAGVRVRVCYCEAALVRFTRPKPNVVSRPAAPRSSTAASSFERIVDAVAVGYLSQMIAVAPATCGVAIDVPDSVV